MPAELFLDTSGWYPIVMTSAPDHARLAHALRQRVQSGYRVTTTNLVVAETHALLLRRAGREPALRFVKQVAVPPNVVVSSTSELEARAVRDWLERFHDQDFSYTDAVSFAVMRERGIREALAVDHHFATAGFAVVP